MTMIVEDGLGRVDSNSYTTLAFVLEYLTNRGRQTQNGWDALSVAEQEAACIAATDFIEQKYGTKFLGIRQFTNLGDTPATNTLAVTGQPVDGVDGVQIGTRVYLWKTVLAVADDVLIGADLFESAQNLADAINATAGLEGVTYGTGTVQNADVGATYSEDTADTPTFAHVRVDSRTADRAGNNLPTTVADPSVMAWAYETLVGGSVAGDTQALSFPRSGLVTRSGQVVTGVPADLQKATAEYAVRASASTLQPDPTFDQYGGAVTRVKQVAGPVESDITYSEGSTAQPTLRSYPAADQLLKQYLGAGGAIR